MLKTVLVSVYIAKDRANKLDVTDVLLLLLSFLLTDALLSFLLSDVLRLLLLSPFSAPPTIYTPISYTKGSAPKTEDPPLPKRWLQAGQGVKQF